MSNVFEFHYYLFVIIIIIMIIIIVVVVEVVEKMTPFIRLVLLLFPMLCLVCNWTGSDLTAPY